MTIKDISAQIFKKQSFLCIGLDVDLDKIPKHLLQEEDPIFAFNQAIIDATHDLCVAYKPNTAFYEAHGVKGWMALEKTITYLNKKYPNHFTIADSKRGDIGNTSERYAKAFFDTLGFDSVTVAPYMGADSVEPFLTFDGKYAILLALTSNQGAYDFQTKSVDDEALFLKVIKTSKHWKNSDRLMYVVGATKTEQLGQIRRMLPDSFLLVPGIGAQGGDLEAVCREAMTPNVGLLVNSSRDILYASSEGDFAKAARRQAQVIQEQMAQFLIGKTGN
ncbi:MAG: orotidine-5'-phosphate decarboxylase [Flavobacteriaceae bacterium]|jgi:orotidine-5'-phosphate decarboxylase|nr:orotidine-5'-phosphate decarboxylase [Flavobacteriaceae bacterium]